MKKIAIYMPQPLLEKLQAKSVASGYGLSEVIRQYLEKAVAQESANG